jgi:hypothetical protein
MFLSLPLENLCDKQYTVNCKKILMMRRIHYLPEVVTVKPLKRVTGE